MAKVRVIKPFADINDHSIVHKAGDVLDLTDDVRVKNIIGLKYGELIVEESKKEKKTTRGSKK